MNDRTKLVAPCGLDCGICEVYLCRDNRQLADYLVSTGIPKEVLPCDGCKAIEGKCPVIRGTCATYECAREKKVAYCSECSDFPCGFLSPASDRATVLPHNCKVFNLCTIKRDGVEEFTKKSMQIKNLYYKGKMQIGKGPAVENGE